MIISTVSSKGQVTLPAKMRRNLGIGGNDRVVMKEIDNTIVIRKVASLHDYSGFLGRGLSPETEHQAMLKAVVEHVTGTPE